MRLKRNTTSNGTCKYALIRLDLLEAEIGREVKPQDVVEQAGYIGNFIEFGFPNTPEEFFIIKLKDLNSTTALLAYAEMCDTNGDSELSDDVVQLALRSGPHNKWAKLPD